ncbi:hypothetical protein H6F73_16105 [Microcoleus sp. FACHB-68]|nr:hypothetical protein [Microcoleus sp. FACHB-68]
MGLAVLLNSNQSQQHRTESPLACDEFEFPNVPRSPRKRRLSRFGQA